MANETNFADHLLTSSRRRHCMDKAADLLPFPDGPVVYFIGGPRGPIKIGFTNDLRCRLGDLQVGNPAELTVYAYWRGTLGDEAAAHEAFRLERVRGEWFRREGPVKRTVMSLQAAAARNAGIALSREAKVEVWSDDDV